MKSEPDLEGDAKFMEFKKQVDKDVQLTVELEDFKTKGIVVPKAYVRDPKTTSWFSFRNFYCQYAKFHYNETNMWIHIFCVPIITWTLYVIIESFKLKIVFNPLGLLNM